MLNASGERILLQFNLSHNQFISWSSLKLNNFLYTVPFTGKLTELPVWDEIPIPRDRIYLLIGESCCLSIGENNICRNWDRSEYAILIQFVVHVKMGRF